MKNYYKTLGINSNASQEEINKAYRNLVIKYHPDKNKDENSIIKFKEIQEAYENLKNTKPSFSFKNSVDDIFDNIFSKIFGNQKTNKSSKVRIKITLEESYRGCEKNIEIDKYESCEDCSGTGGLSWVSCEKCDGKGFVFAKDAIALQLQSSCSYCEGKGNIIREKCKKCNSNGFFVSGKKSLLVKIPAGIKDNTQIRLSGENFGEDLYVVVNIQKDNFFERKDYDLICDLEVPYYVLVFGGDFDLPVFRERIKVKIKPRTKTGSKIIVDGLGFPHLENEKNRGNIQVSVHLLLPGKMTKEHKELLEKLKNF